MSTGRTGKVQQSYRRSWDATEVTVTLLNTNRSLTQAEIEAAEALFRAAEVFSETFYGSGMKIPERSET